MISQDEFDIAVEGFSERLDNIVESILDHENSLDALSSRIDAFTLVATSFEVSIEQELSQLEERRYEYEARIPNEDAAYEDYREERAERGLEDRSVDDMFSKLRTDDVS